MSNVNPPVSTSQEKSITESSPIYTTIIHAVRIKLGLSLIEYCVYDMIHRLSHNRWCILEKESMAYTIGVDVRTVYRAIDKGIKSGFIEPPEKKLSERDGRLKTTELWYQAHMTGCQAKHDKMSDYNNNDNKQRTYVRIEPTKKDSFLYDNREGYTDKEIQAAVMVYDEYTKPVGNPSGFIEAVLKKTKDMETITPPEQHKPKIHHPRPQAEIDKERDETRQGMLINMDKVKQAVGIEN